MNIHELSFSFAVCCARGEILFRACPYLLSMNIHLWKNNALEIFTKKLILDY